MRKGGIMGTDYALDLSFGTVRLMRRHGEAWAEMGSVALTDPRFARHLASLRETAGAADGMAVDLVIPDVQILYTRAPDLASVPATLEGATPYAVADLAWGAAETAGGVAVAATTRRTLDEALDFTRQHGFAPQRLLARPADANLPQEFVFPQEAASATAVAPVAPPACAPGGSTRGGAAPRRGRRMRGPIAVAGALVAGAVALAAFFLMAQDDAVAPTAEPVSSRAEAPDAAPAGEGMQDVAPVIAQAPTAEAPAPPPADETAADPAPPTSPATAPAPPETAPRLVDTAPPPPDQPPADRIDTLYLAERDPAVPKPEVAAMPERAAASATPTRPPAPPPQIAAAVPSTETAPEAADVAPLAPDPDVLTATGASDAPDATIATSAPEEPKAETETEIEATVAAPALAVDGPALRPLARPQDLVAEGDVAALVWEGRDGLPTLRPQARPGGPAASGAATGTEILVPETRPRSFAALAREAQAQSSGASAGTLKSAASTPSGGSRGSPEEQPEPEATSAAPRIPTSASVARQATVQNALRLNRTSLIGVYGPASGRRALVRLPSGRYVKVQVGDRFDGGQIAAIGASDLRYVKGGQSYTLTMPKT